MNTTKIVFLLLLFVFLSFKPSAQELEVTGKITAFDELGLSKVSVTSKKSGNEALSDTAGYYSITCTADDKLVFEANGFFKKRVKLAKVNPADSVNVNLKLKNGDKSIEVATGYNHIDKDELTHSIEHINNQEDFSNYDSIIDIIDSKVSGVNRGAYSFNKNRALLVLDGSIVDNDFIKNIPTSEVKTLNLLTSTSASARYGSRGMHGVIVVETKSGN